MEDWFALQSGLAEFARKQLFFVGGAPRSGTTWLQQMLDAHPEVCCRGEGLFLHHLAVPLEKMMAARSKVLESKNREIFAHTGGYPLPVREDIEFLTGSAIMLAMKRHAEGIPCRAVGEKTPENVFFFARLKQIFPQAKFIAIARDPRDVLASAWHFFARKTATGDERAAKIAFIKTALPSLAEGARTMTAFAARHPQDCAIVVYERLLRDPAPSLTHLFRLIGVAHDPAVVAGCVSRTSFKSLSGRERGDTQDGAFFRRGTAGGWRDTFNEEMNQQILKDMGFMFQTYGWNPDA